MKNVWGIRIGTHGKDHVYYLPTNFYTRKKAREYREREAYYKNDWHVVKLMEKK